MSIRLIPIEKNETQQFAKFFLKDLKTKTIDYQSENVEISEFKFSSAS